MALVLKKSGDSSAVRRRPLLPDDRFLDGRVAEVTVEDVDDKFNGGKKKMIFFTVELPKFKDPQDDEGGPRRVRIKANMPDKGKGVHEKSNLYKFVKAVMGRDPWAEDEGFDLETIVKKKMPIRVMMSTSEPMEKEVIENEGDDPVVVNDYQYQWVSSYRSATGAGDAEDTGEAAPAATKAAPAKTATPKAAPAPAKAAAAAPAKGKPAAKPAPEPEPEVEAEAEPEVEAEVLCTEEQQASILAAMKTKAANEVGKKKVIAALKAVACAKPSELWALPAEKVKAFCNHAGIPFPASEEESTEDGDLDFLKG